MNILVFSGGRGTNTILKSLLKYNEFSVKICLNAYDDGLSTGMLRKFIPGFLGPSDIRKNASVFLSSKNDKVSKSISKLIEYRFRNSNSEQLIVKQISDFINKGSFDLDELDDIIHRLTVSNLIFFKKYIQIFFKFYNNNISNNSWFRLFDMSFGNLVLAGIFIETNDFNETINIFTSNLEIHNSILNITKGENLILTGITKDGDILKTEADIVSPHGSSPISDIYLIDSSIYKKINFTKNSFEENNIFPSINEIAKKYIEQADIIIYGPGTQSASLFPSYLTIGCAEAIIKNTKALKIFINNLKGDNDYQDNNPISLLENFNYFMNRKGLLDFKIKDLITHCLINSSDNFEAPKFRLQDIIKTQFRIDNIIIKQFESNNERHSGIKITHELVSLISNKYNLDFYKINLPIQKVLIILIDYDNLYENKNSFDKSAINLNLDFETVLITTNPNKNILFPGIDFQINTSEPLDSVTTIKKVLPITDADGFVLFPNDDSYSFKDLIRIIEHNIMFENSLVIGTRAFSFRKIDERLTTLYGSNISRKILSRIGGFVIKNLYLYFNHIVVSDPFSRIISFNRSTIENLPNIKSQSSIFHNLILEAKKRKFSIIEIPVFYNATNVKKRNYIKMNYGINLIFKLLFRFR
jgi:2-phospho-L-lactate transferase/gluconeogenesis factor (CofD/UPF0052 family)